jgi:hypothetical protein
MDLQAFMPEGTTFRQGIVECENAMKSGAVGDVIDLKVVHHFAPGIYARELHIPAGVALTGAIHKTEHLFILSAGEIEQISENEGLHRIKAPFTCISKPGVKRMGFALSDAVVTTIHPTNETDVDKLRADLVCETYEEYELFLIASTKQISEVN